MDDVLLISRVISDQDQRAFAELVKRHQSQLRYSLRQLTGWDTAMADDIAQETFIKAYQSLTQYRGEAKFSTWLYRIAYHLFISHCRKRSEVTFSEPPLPEEPDSSQTQATQLHIDLARAMQQLSPEQRAALHLFLHQEYSHQEIADIMDCPLGTVKSHITRGREKLQQILAQWREEVIA